MLFLLIGVSAVANAQQAAKHRIIITQEELNNTVQYAPDKQLTNLSGIPGIRVDLRYAGNNNFTHTTLYSNARPYMRKPAAEALKRVQADMNRQGLGLMVFDAYRPLVTTKKIWDIVHDSRYAANPANGSAHNRALAIDLTIVDIKTGRPLDMGTGFDNFSDTAGHAFRQLPAAVLKNRQQLKQIMEYYGFVALSTEWWHYSWPNNKDYELLDIDFKELDR